MKIAITIGVIAMTFSLQATASEPEVKPVARDHVLGRVFMSSAERRQLDLLRKAPPSTGRSAPVSAATQSTAAAQRKKSSPVGYIVPSNGRPYQWIDGDFRHVAQADVDSTKLSQSIEITRHENNSASDDSLPERGEPASPTQEKRLDAEAGNANPSQQ